MPENAAIRSVKNRATKATITLEQGYWEGSLYRVHCDTHGEAQPLDHRVQVIEHTPDLTYDDPQYDLEIIDHLPNARAIKWALHHPEEWCRACTHIFNEAKP